MKTRILDDLKLGPQPVTIPVGKDGTTVWIRRPNTPEKQMCESAGRAASRELRKLLQDEETEEFKQLVQAEVSGYELDELRMIWIAGELVQRVFRKDRQTLEGRDQTFVPEPTSEDGVNFPSQAAFDNYENQVEAIEQQRVEAVEAFEKQEAEALMDEVKKKNRKQLEKIARPKIIDGLCGQAYNEAYSAALLARCTFEDEECKTPMFKTVEEVRSVFRDRPKIAKVLSEGHGALMLDPEEAKN